MEIVRRYDFDIFTAKWNSRVTYANLNSECFAVGSMRAAHHLDLFDSDGNHLGRHVAKFYANNNNSTNEREKCFTDVKVQAIAKWLAGKYNDRNPPKRIDFLDAFVLEFLHRNGRPHCAVEKLLVGNYVKHNNNIREMSDSERYTPQAFSHFTYEVTKGKLLVCDMQGVNDIYTDPQILTRSGKEFGDGNLGENGMKIFLRSHDCNPICRLFNLHTVKETKQKKNISSSTIMNLNLGITSRVENETKGNDRERDWKRDENEFLAGNYQISLMNNPNSQREDINSPLPAMPENDQPRASSYAKYACSDNRKTCTSRVKGNFDIGMENISLLKHRNSPKSKKSLDKLLKKFSDDGTS